ncbi:transposase zinc-binding domain-containing protein [Fusobacterium sp.]|uniref:transposase zinc-binding domain-containing protein n=1 Tax=Fusobacterium sp. TaxID=68766 RepID=UPI00345BF138
MSKFFFKYWEQIKFHFNNQKQNDIIDTVCTFLNCGNPKLRFSAFVCPKCWNKLIVPFIYKSKLCPSCGIICAKNRHKVYMLNFLMLNIFISLFLFLLDLLEISFLKTTLNFVL